MHKLSVLFAFVIFLLPSVLAADCCKLCDNGDCNTMDMTGLENAPLCCTNLGGFYFDSYEFYQAESCGSSQMPEFGTIAALFALAGSATAYFILRK
jgi:hypothetical protein